MTYISREDNVVAALCHLSALLPLIGLAVPLTIWLTQRDRAPLLGYQALQAFVYQIAGIAAYFILYICQMGFMMGSFAIIPFAILLSSDASNTSGGGNDAMAAFMIVVFAIFMLVFMIIYFFQCVGWPLFMVLAMWATWRILKGDPYQYPILGRWVEAKLVSSSVAELDDDPAPVAPTPAEQSS